jgi:hypothetical protein
MKVLRIVTASLLACSSLAAVAAPSTNLIVNGSFEAPEINAGT